MRVISRERSIKIWEFTQHVLDSFQEDDCAKQAAALAYFGLFSIFPLLLFLVYIGSYFLSSDALRPALDLFITRVFPAGADNLIRTMNQTIEARGSIGMVSIISLLWGGSSVFSVLETSLNGIWESPPRSYWRRRALAAISVVTLGLVFLSSLFLGPLTGWLLDGRFGDGELLSYMMELILSMLAALLLYRIFPNENVPWGPAFLGALIGAILLVVSKFIFGIIIGVIISNYGLVYGSLAWFLSIALWVYFIGLLLLLGAEFAAAFQKRNIV